MSGLIESATAILSASERRLEITAHNVANISTPGFKRQSGFSQILAARGQIGQMPPEVAVHRDFSQGKLRETGNPLDLAISGSGFFQLRAGDRLIYSRQGQFSVSADGNVVTPQGYVLQQQGGGDLVLRSADGLSIDQEGVVLEAGVPVARLAVYTSPDLGGLQALGDSHFLDPAGAMEIVSDAVIRQGIVENSNVEIGEEMVGMMSVIRQSEAGARLVQTWDDLIGRALTTFGQAR